MGTLTNVVLDNAATNTTKEFEINHAERLLRMPNNGGWRLPEDSPFTFDFKNGIGFKQDTGTDIGKKESRRNK